MKRIGAAVILVAITLPALAQSAPEPAGGVVIRAEAPADATADLAPTGKLRAAINFGNTVLAQRDPASGQPQGVSVDLARELGRRLGVPVEIVAFEAAAKVFDSLKAGAWDIAFLAIDPARAAEIAFTGPYLLIEGGYLAPADSPLQRIEDVDRAGVRIAAGKGSAYDLYLSRTLKQAQLVHAATSPGAIELFMRERLDAAAGVRQQLLAFARTHPDVRVMEGRFMAIEQAMGTPKGRDAAARYLRQFVEEVKASGFVAEALRRSGQADATVAPPSPRP